VIFVFVTIFNAIVCVNKISRSPCGLCIQFCFGIHADPKPTGNLPCNPQSSTVVIVSHLTREYVKTPAPCYRLAVTYSSGFKMCILGLLCIYLAVSLFSSGKIHSIHSRYSSRYPPPIESPASMTFISSNLCCHRGHSEVSIGLLLCRTCAHCGPVRVH